jgi:hypothetical protein
MKSRSKFGGCHFARTFLKVWLRQSEMSSIRRFVSNSLRFSCATSVKNLQQRKPLHLTSAQFSTKKVAEKESCASPVPPVDDDDLSDMEEMFVLGPAGMEWGGPTRGKGI